MRQENEMNDRNRKYAGEKHREMEREKDIAVKENGNLREMVKALEIKNDILLKKIEQIKNEQNLSFLDLKLIFGKADKTLTKTRLIDELFDMQKQEAK